MTKTDLQKMIEQETRCAEWFRDNIDYCKALKEDYCPLTCSYAKKELKTEDYKRGMK
jgi:hypothetical protein